MLPGNSEWTPREAGKEKDEKKDEKPQIQSGMVRGAEGEIRCFLICLSCLALRCDGAIERLCSGGSASGGRLGGGCRWVGVKVKVREEQKTREIENAILFQERESLSPLKSR